jgi:hypothetical protein
VFASEHSFNREGARFAGELWSAIGGAATTAARERFTARRLLDVEGAVRLGLTAIEAGAGAGRLSASIAPRIDEARAICTLSAIL